MDLKSIYLLNSEDSNQSSYQTVDMSWSPGLVVMVQEVVSSNPDDIFTLICCKICIVCMKRPNINQNRGQGWPVFLKQFIG